MNKIYIVDGVKYNVAPNREEEFLKKFPNGSILGSFWTVKVPEPILGLSFNIVANLCKENKEPPFPMRS